MISMRQAKARVDDRLDALAFDHGETVVLEAWRPICAGTDVPAPDLERELQVSCLEIAREAVVVTEDDEVVLRGPVIGGVLARMFWLGFEFGKANE